METQEPPVSTEGSFLYLCTCLPVYLCTCLPVYLYTYVAVAPWILAAVADHLDTCEWTVEGVDLRPVLDSLLGDQIELLARLDERAYRVNARWDATPPAEPIPSR